MKNAFLFFVVIITLTSCGGNATKGTGPQFDTTGYEVTDIDETNVQLAVRYGENDKVLEEGILVGGVKNGLWVTYHDDKPMPKIMANFVNGLYTGTYMEFSNRGQMEKRIGYKNNDLHGVYGTYKFGRIVETVPYKNGKMHGKYISNFNNSDKLQKEIDYQNGEKHGKFKQFNEDGSTLVEYEYKNDEKVGGGVVEK